MFFFGHILLKHVFCLLPRGLQGIPSDDHRNLANNYDCPGAMIGSVDYKGKDDRISHPDVIVSALVDQAGA